MSFANRSKELARQVPSLAGTRRLNKHMIVEHSIARHQAQRELCLSAAQDFRALLAERDELLAEVNQWRSASGATFPPREARPVGQQCRSLLGVEKETFGVFPNGFGDNPPEGGSGDDQEYEEAGYNTADDAGACLPTVMEMPPDDQRIQTGSDEPLISPGDQIHGLFDIPPSSIDAANSRLCAFERAPGGQSHLDYGSLLSHDASFNDHNDATTILESMPPMSGPDNSSSHGTFRYDLRNGFQLPVSNEMAPTMPHTNSIYEPFNHMHLQHAQEDFDPHPPVFLT